MNFEGVKKLLGQSLVVDFQQGGKSAELSEWKKGMKTYSLMITDSILKDEEKSVSIIKESFFSTLPRSTDMLKRGIRLAISLQKLVTMEDIYQVSIYWEFM